MRVRVFRIESRSIIPETWGDYGRMLQHGMTSHLRRVGGLLALERTGPYIPPITLPGIGDVVLTSAARRLLGSSGLTGFDFRPVEKVLTVELHWETWDLTAAAPLRYPDSGEPEDYVLGQPNSDSASAALGEVWEIVIPNTARIVRLKESIDSDKDWFLDLSTWNGTDLFRSNSYAGVLLSEDAREWFADKWGRYVSFSEFPTNL
jgi:hypothetical protein